MKKTCFNLESSTKADGLAAKPVWEKADEIVKRLPSHIINSAPFNDHSSTSPPMDLCHQQQHPYPYVISDHDYSKKSSNHQMLPTDSHIVPDNDYDDHIDHHDDEQQQWQQHSEHEFFMGNYMMNTGSNHDQKTPKSTSTEVIRSSSSTPSHHHRHHHHVNSREKMANCDDELCKCERTIKRTTSSCTKTRSTSPSRRAAGLLDFIKTTGQLSRARDDHDGIPLPVVVAPAPITSTPGHHNNPTLLLLVPTNDDDDDDHPLLPREYSTPKQLISPSNSKAPATTTTSTSRTRTAKRKLGAHLLDEALVPSFSVCSNDVPCVSAAAARTTTSYDHDHDDDNDHYTSQDDSECPSKSVEVDEQPQLRPPSTYKAPPRVSERKGRTTTVHNLSERRRRYKINKKMRTLQALIPNCNKVNKASILDEAITYMKTLQLQLRMMSMGTGVMPPHPLMLGTGAPAHLRTTFALPHPTFHMLGFPPPPPVAPFVPLNIAPSLPLVPPSISLSLSSSRNSNPTHRRRDHRTKYS